MKNWNITIDENSGFCFGVIYAIEMAEGILDTQDYLYCLGDIVHNDEEVNRLKKRGLRIISHEDLVNIKNEKVLIRAHGEPPSTYHIALQNNIELVDASCPVVLKLQNRVKNTYDKERNVYIYGKHGHAEVVGLLGQTNNNAIVFEDIKELDIEKMPRKIALFSQTTKSTDKLYSIKKTLEDAGIEVDFNDTICRQVSNRDIQLREFAKKYDKIIFVSGTKSSNGKVLYNVCKDTNPNTHFVSGTGEISCDWFCDEKLNIGICGATSTPMWLMQDVRNTILSLAS